MAFLFGSFAKGKNKPLIAWEALRGEKILIKDHNLYLDLLLNVSSEAIDLQEFILDVYKIKSDIIRIIKRIEFIKSETQDLKKFKEITYEES